MSLTDAEILELNELCGAVVDGTLTETQKAILSHRLSTSEEARQFYVRVLGLSASLHSYAGEMQTGEPDTLAFPTRAAGRWKWVIGLLSIAAAVALVLWIDRPTRRDPEPAIAEAPATSDNEFVASLTGSKECVWANNTPSIEPRARLRKGQQIELDGGFAEITFDSGAQVLLQGPASFNVTSAWSATLTRGTLKASLPPEAMGFSISNPTVEVVDLGTEFTMFADAGGTAAEVLVLKGEVEAAPRTPVDQQFIKLREKESRRFASTGVSAVHNSEQKFEALTHPVQLEHYVSQAGYAHWSFDETEGNLFKAEAFGLSFDAPHLHLESVSESALSPAHARGRWNGALRFDGSFYAKAAFPGISDNVPHTVSFWAKVPKDANISNAYAMVAWGVNDEKLGSHPIQIVWNRNASEGNIGVLRTDYSGGYALGATPLRDGRWHHIAVVFIPRDDPQRPIEVNQYVDGRLEGESKSSTPGSDVFMYSNKNAPTTTGTIWLGCRVGPRGARMERFYGDMDELYIADRALEPQEIRALMISNQLSTDSADADGSSRPDAP